jgi:hypothetical protein
MMTLDKYKTLKKLGNGAYSKVLLVEDYNGKQYALKIIEMKLLKS